MQKEAAAAQLDNLFDMVLAGGGLMVPIGLCSIIALAYIVERSVRLRGSRLGGASFGDQLCDKVANEGPDAGLDLCAEEETSTARVLAAGLKRADAPWVEREKAVEDAGSREVQRLSANLKPYKGRIDRFVRRTEDLYMEVSDLLSPSSSRGAAAGSEPTAR